MGLLKHLLLKFKDEFINIVSFRKFCIFLIFVVCFFYYQNFIDRIICRFFLIDSQYVDILPLWFFRLSSVIVILFILFLLIKREYRFSIFQFLFSFNILYVFYYYKKYSEIRSWEFVKIKDSDTLYLELLIFPLLLFCIVSILSYIINGVESYFKEEKKSILYDDSPIKSKEKDLFKYQDLAESISEVILNSSYSKSFTIGIVGPWGNGKSSLMTLVSEEIKNQNSKNIISFKFYPYLNHNDEEIISEFFNLLSVELKKFSGALSNQILEYSDKLISLYKDLGIKNFFSNKIKFDNDYTTIELYNRINETLKTLNKKFIIYIDDLDRLSDKEILQLLKLIRNSANFYNCFFLVAMDKDYVIASLKNDDSILNTKFVDKFFQLEVYLPELDKSELRIIFLNLIKTSRLSTIPEFINRFELALQSDENLFEDYVYNVRDIKRITNQLIFDYNFIGEDLDLKDFMNFTYLKLRFPRIVQLLKDKREKYLINIDNKYTLRTDSTEEHDINAIRQDEAVYDDYREFELYKNLKGDNDVCSDLDKSIDCEDIELIVKTLDYLFGKNNIGNDYRSIRFPYNFRKAIRLRYEKEDLTHKEFLKLINSSNESVLYESLDNIIENKKINQVLSNINYFNSDDELQNRNLTWILLYSYEKIEEFEIDKGFVYRLVLEYFDAFSKDSKDEEFNFESRRYQWFKKFIIENSMLREFNKLMLIGNIWQVKIKDVKLDDILLKPTLNLYKKYLDNVELWNVNDYSFYGVYHSLKKILVDVNDINKLIRDFWKKNDIELFCAQTIEFNVFSTVGCKMSITIREIYGSDKKFFEEVKSHNSSNNASLKEYLFLYKLIMITKHESFIIFNFVSSKLMLKRIKTIRQSPAFVSEDEYKNRCQVFFESTNSEIFDSYRKGDNLNKLGNTVFTGFYEYEGKYYYMIEYNASEKMKLAIDYSNEFATIAKVNLNWNVVSKTELRNNISAHEIIAYKGESKTNANEYIKVLSYQIVY